MENYNIYDEIGRGTHSFVYKARRKRSIEYVAVKSTAKSRMDKVLNEVPFLHKLDSPYVLKFFDWYESSNHIWLILEYCIGGDLLNLITQDKQLPESVVQSFGLELMAGLQYLHANSILYCDLKPANVLIDEYGSLKAWPCYQYLPCIALADFGLARRIPTRDAAANRPLASGSPHYMAPELFQQPAIHSFASDFWALGCVLYELRTGRQPFTHTSFPELAQMIQTETVELPVPGYEMSPAFCDLLECLLVKDPYQRITWDELIDHPFWDNLPRIASVPMPIQEIFDLGRPVTAESERSGNDDDSSGSAVASGADEESQHDSEDEDADNNASLDAIPTATHAFQEIEQAPTRFGEVEEEKDALSDTEEVARTFAHRSNQLDRANNRRVRPVTAPMPSPYLASNNSDVSNLGEDAMRNRSEIGSDAAVPSTTEVRHRWRPSNAPHTAPAAIGKNRPSRKRLQFDGLFDRDGKPGGGLRKISKLIYTAADCHVKSIIRNDAVQLGALPPVDSELLRFGVMTPEELLSCSTEALEDQLKEIYISLKSSTAEEPEKRSVIAYLFSLCRHSKLANVIVNSSILKLLIRMLAQQTRSNASSVATAQNPMLPMLCLVLGMLFRFATFIAPSSPDQLQGLVTTLMGIVHGRFNDLDEESAVVSGGLESRPLALACLGELVFYISTQQEWELPMKGVECVLSCVEAPHIVMRYYAVQTLGNMLVHCTDLLLPRLMSEQIVVALLRGLVQCATADFDDHVDSEESGMNLALRTTITETLAQVLRHLRSPTSAASLPLKLKRSIMLFFAKPEILTAVWRGVQPTPEFFDVAVASLNIVNAFLEMKIVSDREAEQTAIKASRTLLLERVVTFPAIGRILEIKTARDGEDSETSETATLLRAKALLLLHLGVQLNRSFLLSFIQNQFLDLVEQILVPFSSHLQSSAGDTESSAPRVQLPAMEMYLAQCALNLCKLTIRMALKLGADCFSSHEDTGDQDHTGDTDSLTRRRPPQIASASFELFHGLLANPTCQLQFVHYFVANESNQYTFFLRLMAKLLSTFPNERLSLSRGSTTTTVALYVSEILLDLFQFAATEANAIVFVEKEMLFTLLLPAVVEHVLPSRDEADAAEEREDLAASSMRILYTVLLNFDYTTDESDEGKEDEDFRGTFIRLHLLPCFKSMLSGAEAVDESAWRFASEFLIGLLSSDSSLLQETEALQLAPIIVGLLNLPGNLGFRSLPPSVTRLVKMLIDREDVPMGLLYEADIAGSLLSSLAFIVQKESWVSSLTDLLAVLLHLLHARYESMRQSEESLAAPPGFDKLADCSPLMIQLCAAHAHEGDLQEQPEELSPGKSSPVSTEIREGAQMTREVVDLASRCLVFLSQIFGEKLNDVVFTEGKRSQSGVEEPSVAMALISCLDRCEAKSDSAVVLRVLLTLKNCLRCEGNNVSVSLWLRSNKHVIDAITGFASHRRPSGRGSGLTPTRLAHGTTSVSEQITKTAAGIMRLCRAADSSRQSSS